MNSKRALTGICFSVFLSKPQRGAKVNFKKGITSICHFIVTVNGNFKYFFFEDPRSFRRSKHVSFIPSKEFFF